jgi:hypothetical protein
MTYLIEDPPLQARWPNVAEIELRRALSCANVKKTDMHI